MEKESSRVGVVMQNTVDEELRESRKSDAGTAFSEFSEKCEELRQASVEMSSDKNPGARWLSSGLSSMVSATGSVPGKLEAGLASGSTQGFEKDLVRALPAPPDVLILYWTLVRDGVFPKGYELKFASLEAAIRKGAARALKRTAGSDNQSAAVWLHRRQQESASKARSEKLAVDQLLLASSERPSRFRAKWQEKFFDGPLQERMRKMHCGPSGSENSKGFREQRLRWRKCLRRGKETYLKSASQGSEEVPQLACCLCGRRIPNSGNAPHGLPGDAAFRAVQPGSAQECTPIHGFPGGCGRH